MFLRVLVLLSAALLIWTPPAVCGGSAWIRNDSALWRAGDDFGAIDATPELFSQYFDKLPTQIKQLNAASTPQHHPYASVILFYAMRKCKLCPRTHRAFLNASRVFQQHASSPDAPLWMSRVRFLDTDVLDESVRGVAREWGVRKIPALYFVPPFFPPGQDPRPVAAVTTSVRDAPDHTDTPALPAHAASDSGSPADGAGNTEEEEEEDEDWVPETVALEASSSPVQSATPPPQPPTPQPAVRSVLAHSVLSHWISHDISGHPWENAAAEPHRGSCASVLAPAPSLTVTRGAGRSSRDQDAGSPLYFDRWGLGAVHIFKFGSGADRYLSPADIGMFVTCGLQRFIDSGWLEAPTVLSSAAHRMPGGSADQAGESGASDETQRIVALPESVWGQLDALAEQVPLDSPVQPETRQAYEQWAELGYLVGSTGLRVIVVLALCYGLWMVAGLLSAVTWLDASAATTSVNTRRSEGWTRPRAFGFLLSVVFFVWCLSGQMYNIHKNPPNVGVLQSGGLLFLYPSSMVQLKLESYLVFVLLLVACLAYGVLSLLGSPAISTYGVLYCLKEYMAPERERRRRERLRRAFREKYGRDPTYVPGAKPGQWDPLNPDDDDAGDQDVGLGGEAAGGASGGREEGGAPHEGPDTPAQPKDPYGPIRVPSSRVVQWASRYSVAESLLAVDKPQVCSLADSPLCRCLLRARGLRFSAFRRQAQSQERVARLYCRKVGGSLLQYADPSSDQRDRTPPTQRSLGPSSRLLMPRAVQDLAVHWRSLTSGLLLGGWLLGWLFIGLVHTQKTQ